MKYYACKKCGDKKYKKEMVKSRTHEVQQADEEYDDAYDTGVFSPLLGFCIAHGMESAKEDNEAAMLAFVEEKFPDLAIEKGKCGGLGVFTSDLKAGEYRYKRGVRASTSHKQKEGMHERGRSSAREDAGFARQARASLGGTRSPR